MGLPSWNQCHNGISIVLGLLLPLVSVCVLLQDCSGENNGGRNNIKVQDSTTLNDACYDNNVYKSYRVGDVIRRFDNTAKCDDKRSIRCDDRGICSVVRVGD